ncbi:Pro-Pol polyprotein [Choanephora cucurbitarum]|uniref:Pro-Pol polyprotein n=1 Tax=Choanephora cucurbitarum TaxID=101091 RepID=A0A1C7NCQ4_9FUNG|nr:Pro-Pol polyprotein [Choanephora cucurbitarum]
MVKAVHNNGMHWPKLREQALMVAKKCAQCQKFNIVKTGYNPHKPVHSSLPGDHWAIDLAGPLPVTERNNRYMLVMIDICTRFVILRPIPNKTAEAVVQALIPVFCDFGIPRILQSDNGKEFANQVMQRFKAKAWFDHRLITPY